MSINRNQRRAIAQDTLTCLEQGYYTNTMGQKVSLKEAQQYAQQQTQLYSPEASLNLLKKICTIPTRANTRYQVKHESTLEAVCRLLDEGKERVLALNFASAKNPGGGFLGGSQAQEESLARSTGLYPCLLEAEEYYHINRKTSSCFYTDYIIYTPQVPLLKNDHGDYHFSLKKASFITAPAVNKGAIKRHEAERLSEIPQVMKQRLSKILAIAQAHQYQHLVLGAWGCGVFQNDPQEVAQYFKEVLEGDFKGVFEQIVFAIYAKEQRFIEPFQRCFK